MLCSVSIYAASVGTDWSSAYVQVAQSPQFPEGIRQLAAEFLVCLCEAREKAPGMMRKLPQYISQLFSCMLLFLLDVTVSPAPPVYVPALPWRMCGAFLKSMQTEVMRQSASPTRPPLGSASTSMSSLANRNGSMPCHTSHCLAVGAAAYYPGAAKFSSSHCMAAVSSMSAAGNLRPGAHQESLNLSVRRSCS